MKAIEIKKESITVDEIYERIKATPSNINKLPFMFNEYISAEVKQRLMEDGFKCYYGNGFSTSNNEFIIEW